MGAMVVQSGSTGCSEDTLVAQPGSDGCFESACLLSLIALAKVVISQLLRMKREPSQVVVTGSLEGDGYCDCLARQRWVP